MSDFLSENDWAGFAGMGEEETEFIPLISAEDEERMDNEIVPEQLPILSLRNNVLFPGVVIPITVGRDKSIKLIQDAYKTDKIIGVVSQKDFALYLTTLATFFSSPLTPLSFVYDSIIFSTTLSSIENNFFDNPCSFICLGVRCLLAISIFSSTVYPFTSISSILSNNAGCIVPNSLAVAINITLDMGCLRIIIRLI